MKKILWATQLLRSFNMWRWHPKNDTWAMISNLWLTVTYAFFFLPGFKESLENRKNKSIDSFLICTFPVGNLAHFVVCIETLRWKIYDWSSFGWGHCSLSFCSDIAFHATQDQEEKGSNVLFLHSQSLPQWEWLWKNNILLKLASLETKFSAY